MFISTYKKIALLLSKEEKNLFFRLAILIIFISIIDTLSVATLYPFISIISNSEYPNNKIINQIINFLEIKEKSEIILLFGLIALLTITLSIISRSYLVYATLKFVTNREFSIAKRVVEKYLSQSYIWYLEQNSAHLTKNILSEIATVVGGVLLALINILSQSVITILLLLFLMAINLETTLFIAVIIISSYLLIYKISRKTLSKIGKDRLKLNKQRFSIVLETFSGIKEIKTNGFEKVYLRRFISISRQYADCQAKLQAFSQMPRFFLEFLIILIILILIIYLTFTEGSLLQTLPILATYAFSAFRLIPSLQQVYVNVSNLKYSLPTLEELIAHLELLDKKHIIDTKKNEILKSSNSIYKISNAIELKGINFKYPNSDKLIIKDINLNVKKGSFISFVGKTGAGKTTLLDLIIGLLEPTNGYVQLFGKSWLNEPDKLLLQSKISYVPQNIFLVDDSIEMNIAFGSSEEDIDSEKIINSAKTASIHDFIVEELPQCFKTRVGERGIMLSGGQRQRIGIARALYRNPSLLVLDEATNALDSITENIIINSIKNNNPQLTIIMIAHRLNIIKNADEIFLLEDGLISDFGKFDYLFENNKSFALLVNQQR